jgi:hypothetical protein
MANKHAPELVCLELDKLTTTYQLPYVAFLTLFTFLWLLPPKLAIACPGKPSNITIHPDM